MKKLKPSIHLSRWICILTIGLFGFAERTHAQSAKYELNSIFECCNDSPSGLSESKRWVWNSWGFYNSDGVKYSEDSVKIMLNMLKVNSNLMFKGDFTRLPTDTAKTNYKRDIVAKYDLTYGKICLQLLDNKFIDVKIERIAENYTFSFFETQKLKSARTYPKITLPTFQHLFTKEFVQIIYGPFSGSFTQNNISFDISETKSQATFNYLSPKKFKYFINFNLNGAPADNMFKIIENQHIVPQANATFTWNPLIFYGICNRPQSKEDSIRAYIQRTYYCIKNKFEKDSLDHVFMAIQQEICLKEKLRDKYRNMFQKPLQFDSLNNIYISDTIAPFCDELKLTQIECDSSDSIKKYFTVLKELDGLYSKLNALNYFELRVKIDEENKIQLLENTYQSRFMWWGSLGGGYIMENFNLLNDDTTALQAPVTNATFHGFTLKAAFNFFILNDRTKRPHGEAINFRNHFLSLGVQFTRQNNRRDLNEFDVKYAYSNVYPDTTQGVSRSVKVYNQNEYKVDYVISPFVDYIWFFTKKRNLGLNLFGEVNYFTNRIIHTNTGSEFNKYCKLNAGAGIFVSIPDKNRDRPATNLSIQLKFNDIAASLDPLSPNAQRIDLSFKSNIPFFLGKNR